MNIYNDLDIIIQGPLNSSSLENIFNYKKFGTIIVSHWEGDDKSLIENLKRDSEINIVTIPEVHAGAKLVSDYRVHQWQTTLEGLRLSTKKYSIKVRSDEYYTDLSPLIDSFILDDSKMVTGNVFWKGNSGSHRFHICDHLMICKTEVFCKSLEILFQDIENGKAPKGACESAFGLYYLCAKLGLSGEQIKSKDCDKLLKDHFDHIDVNLLGDYKICWNVPSRRGKSRVVFNKTNPYIGLV